MSQQLLAKVGVLGLIVVNLGAYYALWPASTAHVAGDRDPVGTGPRAMEKAENVGKPLQIMPTAGAAQPVEQAKPSPLPGEIASSALPLPEPLVKAVPEPPPSGIVLPPIPKPFDPVPPTGTTGTLIQAKAVDPTIEQLKRLKESFGKETGTKVPPLEPFTVPAKEFPNLKPVPAPVDNLARTPGHAEVSPWSIQMEIAGGQKVLTARLQKRAEFRIICDQVEMKTLDGAVVAMGKVTFTGPGLKGSCNRLTLGLSADSLILDGKAEVQVQQSNPLDPAIELRGEQLALRLQQSVAGLTPVQSLPQVIPPTSATTTPQDLLPAVFPIQKKTP
jgi:hypothetical protein